MVSPLAAQPLWYGPILANYTLGSRSGRTARTAVIALQIVMTVALRPSPDTMFRGVFVCVTAYAIGRAVALGRAHAAALEDRAARAENERRLEAARAEAESERAAAESERATAESERAEAESRRAAAEAERAVAQAERAAAAERARIARDMHDILAHAVSLMVVQAESGPLLVASDPARAAATFDAVAETGRDAMAQLRRVLALLKDGEDASRSPQPTLADLPELAGRVAGAGLAVDHRVLGEPRPLPADVELAAYRIAQEALTNTVKHSRAEHVELILNWRSDALELTVRDDGNGTREPGGRAPLPSGGNGLIGIRERAAACGGTAETGPRDDGRPGFAVRAVLPVTPAAARTPVSAKISA
ncbi:sensor histidine kinase [Actinomadura harenae]|uniref:histidine kinase n=2 Tax=Actinomadura harenae TaxID=2483351 RepID=A0A3M2LQ42_9ACTN|nr:sensor histidine kinase [Actinomadura harenae]